MHPNILNSPGPVIVKAPPSMKEIKQTQIVNKQIFNCEIKVKDIAKVEYIIYILKSNLKNINKNPLFKLFK